ncbi:MAG: hypothetical protein ACT6WE_32520, partial [Shinella sp.]
MLKVAESEVLIAGLLAETDIPDEILVVDELTHTKATIHEPKDREQPPSGCVAGGLTTTEVP